MIQQLDSTSIAAATGAPNHDASEVAAAQQLLRKAISDRSTVRFFSADPVPDALLAEVLRLTQRAPSAMNMQPYACVVVRDQTGREKLAEAMLDTNGRKVKEAPVTVVFAADLRTLYGLITEPSHRVPLIQEMKLGHGATAAEIEHMTHALSRFSGEGLTADSTNSPDEPTYAWSYKQTIFAATTFLYAAQASGLSTCTMEGFDEAHLKSVLGIPDRYSVPVVISCGYPKPGTERKTATPRLAPTQVFFDGMFGQSAEKLFEA
ncbi:Nitroreductase family, partial [Globisporangium splendens]